MASTLTLPVARSSAVSGWEMTAAATWPLVTAVDALVTGRLLRWTAL